MATMAQAMPETRKAKGQAVPAGVGKARAAPVEEKAGPITAGPVPAIAAPAAVRARAAGKDPPGKESNTS